MEIHSPAPEPRVVVVAVDGSDASVAAVRTARRLFDDARLVLVNVADPVTTVTPPVAPLAAGMVVPPVVDVADTEQLRHAAAAVADHTLVAADLAAGPAETVGALGDPADEVLAIAESRHATAVVVGDHDRGWLSRLLTTSVADEVRSRSSIPVVVVPSG